MQCCAVRVRGKVTCAGCARVVELEDVRRRASVMGVRFFFCRDVCYVYWLDTWHVPESWVRNAEKITYDIPKHCCWRK